MKVSGGVSGDWLLPSGVKVEEGGGLEGRGGSCAGGCGRLQCRGVHGWWAGLSHWKNPGILSPPRRHWAALIYSPLLPADVPFPPSKCPCTAWPLRSSVTTFFERGDSGNWCSPIVVGRNAACKVWLAARKNKWARSRELEGQGKSAFSCEERKEANVNSQETLLKLFFEHIILQYWWLVILLKVIFSQNASAAQLKHKTPMLPVLL